METNFKNIYTKNYLENITKCLKNYVVANDKDLGFYDSAIISDAANILDNICNCLNANEDYKNCLVITDSNAIGKLGDF